MRVLVTARRSRSASPLGAARWALDGELVRPPVRGVDDREGSGDGRWVGLVSGKAADTARVVDMDLQREGLVAAFADACFELDGFDTGDPCPEWVLELVDHHLELASSCEVDALVSLCDGQSAIAPLPLSA